MFLHLRFAFLVAFLLTLSASPALAASLTGKVVKVVDGDTIDVLYKGKAERVRLNGIDTPERGQAFGRKAKEFVLDIAAQKTVIVQIVDKDRYGRTVGEVILPDGKNLNRELVKNGFAWWYRKYSGDASLGILEAEARMAGVGLWKDQNPVPPWEWRYSKNQIRKVSTDSPAQKLSIVSEYHGNIKSRVFHQPSCRQFDCKNCIQVFASRDKAFREGYKPCGICKP